MAPRLKPTVAPRKIAGHQSFFGCSARARGADLPLTEEACEVQSVRDRLFCRAAHALSADDPGYGGSESAAFLRVEALMLTGGSAGIPRSRRYPDLGITAKVCDTETGLPRAMFVLAAGVRVPENGRYCPQSLPGTRPYLAQV